MRRRRGARTRRYRTRPAPPPGVTVHRSPLAAALVAAGLVLAGCGDGTGTGPEERFLGSYRAELDEALGDDAPEYSDAELLEFGQRACRNLADVPDAETLRRHIEAAEADGSEAEVLQVAQATVLVAVAARHLCPDQGARLGLTGSNA